MQVCSSCVAFTILPWSAFARFFLHGYSWRWYWRQPGEVWRQTRLQTMESRTLMAPKVPWFTKAPEGTFDLRLDSVGIRFESFCVEWNLPFRFRRGSGYTVNNLETFLQSKILIRGFRLIAHVKSQLGLAKRFGQLSAVYHGTFQVYALLEMLVGCAIKRQNVRSFVFAKCTFGLDWCIVP